MTIGKGESISSPLVVIALGAIIFCSLLAIATFFWGKLSSSNLSTAAISAPGSRVTNQTFNLGSSPPLPVAKNAERITPSAESAMTPLQSAGDHGTFARSSFNVFRINRYISTAVRAFNLSSDQKHALLRDAQQLTNLDRASAIAFIEERLGRELRTNERIQLDTIVEQEIGLLQLERLENAVITAASAEGASDELLRYARGVFLELRERGDPVGAFQERLSEVVAKTIHSQEAQERLRQLIEEMTSSSEQNSALEVELSLAPSSEKEIERFTTTLNLTTQQAQIVDQLLREIRLDFKQRLNMRSEQQGGAPQLPQQEILKAFRESQSEFEKKLSPILSQEQLKQYERMRDMSAFSQLAD